MSFNDYLLLFGGMGLVTYLPRALPLLYLAHRQIPQWLIDWLSLIPVAILSPLLAPTLFTDTATRRPPRRDLRLPPRVQQPPAHGADPIEELEGLARRAAAELDLDLDELPAVREREPNDDRGRAQRIGIPRAVNGRIDGPGDTDFFRFKGRAGTEVVGEVFGRRLLSPLESLPIAALTSTFAPG